MKSKIIYLFAWREYMSLDNFVHIKSVSIENDYMRDTFLYICLRGRVDRRISARFYLPHNTEFKPMKRRFCQSYLNISDYM